jgi:hypothetical protein
LQIRNRIPTGTAPNRIVSISLKKAVSRNHVADHERIPIVDGLFEEIGVKETGGS